ncbi:MAG: Trk system potassium transporter TrkA [Oscillospiraceae bacterium]|nr:Trk system potassium transporter TrkA [Oscillospiraceae bacterium]
MKIIIIGDGKIGSILAEQLSGENHEVTLIDRAGDPLEQSNNLFDVMVVEGDGMAHAVQKEAGVESADLVIACTGADETNLLCCLIAKKLGAKNTIARVREHKYVEELSLIKDDLGLSMTINPESMCATEMARVLRIPSAIKVDTFARGQVEILKLPVTEGSVLDGMALMELGKLRAKVLVCAVERGENEVYIPTGTFRLQAGDHISLVATPVEAIRFFRQTGIPRSRVRQSLIVGGGRIAFYLAKQLLSAGMDVKIIESDGSRCEDLSELLPEATVIHGDGTDQQLLREEGIEHMDAVVSLTGIDEENIIISLYAARATNAKVITKINRSSYEDIIDDLELGSVFYPRKICADNVVRYVRAMQASNAYASMETLCKISGGKVEALEFRVTKEAAYCGVPLQDLSLRKNFLIGCISRSGKPITPRGSDTIEVGDSVIVVTTHSGIATLDDIFEKK